MFTIHRNNIALLAVVLFACVFAAGAQAQVSGAIYTSTSDGTIVNGNNYDSKSDVYLNGGPPPNAPCTAAGLPDGEYYFQVTDPSGAFLLSTDNKENRRVRVTDGLIKENMGTHATGTGKCPGSISVQLMPFNNTPNPGCVYKVWMTKVSDWDESGPGNVFGFVPSKSKTDNFRTCEGEGPSVVSITGYKWYDTDTDGVKHLLEPWIEGWQVNIDPPSSGGNTYACTAGSGAYIFYVEPNSGAYTISEVAPPPGFVPVPGAIWVPTTPQSGSVTVEDEDIEGPGFGNVCLGPGGGRTLGFWSNKNGQSLFGSDDLAAMVNLNLRDAAGNHFNPANYSGFRTWILGATAQNMAYMLSAQLAAMKLNVLNGFVVGISMLYAGPAPEGCTVSGLNPAGFISVNNLMSAANASLETYGYTPSGHAQRACQEFMKDVLDAANNNKNFVQLEPCPLPACPYYPYPE